MLKPYISRRSFFCDEIQCDGGKTERYKHMKEERERDRVSALCVVDECFLSFMFARRKYTSGRSAKSKWAPMTFFNATLESATEKCDRLKSIWTISTATILRKIAAILESANRTKSKKNKTRTTIFSIAFYQGYLIYV